MNRKRSITRRDYSTRTTRSYSAAPLKSRRLTTPSLKVTNAAPKAEKLNASEGYEVVKVKVIPSAKKPKASKKTSVSINQLKSSHNSRLKVRQIKKTKKGETVVTPTVPSSKKRATKSKSKKRQNYEKKQSIAHHIDELRMRLIGCIMALIVGGSIGYHLQDQIIAWLTKPLGQQLFYTSPTGGFDFLIKICLFFGFLLAIPVIIYNLIRFLAPAVPERVTYSTVKLLVMSMILAIAGVAFAYYISLPAALHFLNNFSNEQVQSLISAQEYFNFAMIYMAGFAALFQMPLIFAFINKITPLKPHVLMQKQRIVILISFIAAAFLTPTPDPMNQTIMAIPMIGLYQTSIGVVWQDNRRKKRKATRQLKRAAKLAGAGA